LIEKDIGDGIKKGFEELGEQMKRVDRELEERAVSFLIQDVRDEQHKSTLFAKVQRLEDAQTKSNSVPCGGNYADRGCYFRISPISDIEVAAAVICMPNAASAALIKKLEPLAPISTSHGYPGTFGPHQTDYVLSTMAPVAKFSDVVKALEGTPNLAVDEEKRIIIVDVPALKPRPARAKDHASAPPK